MVYISDMPDTATESPTVNLAALRENAGLSSRQMARELGVHHSTVIHWETEGRIAKSEFLAPVARILGVSIEELLGLPKSRKSNQVGGRMGQVFEAASRLPRRQQDKIIEFLEPFIREKENGP